MKNKADYSKYECPYSHLKKEKGHELHGPEGYQDVYGVWCTCGFRAPVFYLDPEDLGLKLKNDTIDMENNTSKNEKENDAKSLLSAVDIKEMDEILQSNFNEFRLAIGLPPDVLSEKAKEYFKKAMQQYAELRLGAVIDSDCDHEWLNHSFDHFGFLKEQICDKCGAKRSVQ